MTCGKGIKFTEPRAFRNAGVHCKDAENAPASKRASPPLVAAYLHSYVVLSHSLLKHYMDAASSSPILLSISGTCLSSTSRSSFSSSSFNLLSASSLVKT